MEELKLSRHFWLAELTASAMAQKLKISNQPGKMELIALKALCCNVLDPIRETVGRAVCVSSGYRNEAVNAAVGGEANSQHKRGEAADIYCPGIPTFDLFKLIAASDIPFDQCIMERKLINGVWKEWVHVSYAQKNRREVLHYPGHKPYLPGVPARWPL